MKNKICIILCYFGEFPETIDSFFFSCKNNPDFDWLIFTDCEAKNIPPNVRIVKTTLKDIKTLAEQKLKMSVYLEEPYKLCDYKVAYGLIFEDYTKEYDFWGYGDIDVIYGDLRAFITDELLVDFDKIYPLGHLSLIRNNEKCKRLFMKEVEGTGSYTNVFTLPFSCFFDENGGINDKAEAYGIKIYTNFDFADIDGIYTRFRNVDKKTIKMTLPDFKYSDKLRKNYHNQIFYWHSGSLYQRYYENEKVFDEEISYIHYRRKLKSEFDDSKPVILIIPDGIISCNSVPELSEICKYNKSDKNEYIMLAKAEFDRMKMRFPAVMKDRIITILGKSMMIRKIVRGIKRTFQ